MGGVTPAAGPSAAAAQAAARAGVTVRSVHTAAGCHAVSRVLDDVWRMQPGATQMAPNLVRAVEHAGGYVAAAYAGEEMVAASVAFRSDRGLHSHVTGVVEAVRGRAVGTALKLHQRAWALERGLPEITWTFDPLMRRNAWFNLVTLGAGVGEYLVDHYGPMGDGINAGDETDRLLAVWRLAEPLTAVTEAPGAPLLVTTGPDGGPVSLVGAGSRVVVGLPDDVAALRASAPGLALAWRTAVREALAPLLSGGGTVVGITRHGGYVVDLPEEFP